MALRTRRRLWLPAILLAACLMSHFAVDLRGLRRLRVAVPAPVEERDRTKSIGGVGFLLSVWSVPLIATLSYTTNMRYGTIGEPVSTVSDTGHASRTISFPYFFIRWLGAVPLGRAFLIGIAIVASVGFCGAPRSRCSSSPRRAGSRLSGPSHPRVEPTAAVLVPGIFLLMGIGVAELIRGAGWLGGRSWRWVRSRSGSRTSRTSWTGSRVRRTNGFTRRGYDRRRRRWSGGGGAGFRLLAPSLVWTSDWWRSS